MLLFNIFIYFLELNLCSAINYKKKKQGPQQKKNGIYHNILYLAVEWSKNVILFINIYIHTYMCIYWHEWPCRDNCPAKNNSTLEIFQRQIIYVKYFWIYILSLFLNWITAKLLSTRKWEWGINRLPPSTASNNLNRIYKIC